MMVLACLRSAAMIITVATSPGPRKGRQSRKVLKKTAMSARVKVLPLRLPQTSHASSLARWAVGAGGALGEDARCSSSIGKPNRAARKERQAAQVRGRGTRGEDLGVGDGREYVHCAHAATSSALRRA